MQQYEHYHMMSYGDERGGSALQICVISKNSKACIAFEHDPLLERQ